MGVVVYSHLVTPCSVSSHERFWLMLEFNGCEQHVSITTCVAPKVYFGRQQTYALCVGACLLLVRHSQTPAEDALPS